MLRSLCCAAAVLSLVLSICLLPQTAFARRCPVKLPETLLSLYQNSDAIFVASFDKLTEGEVVKAEDEDYSVQKIQKHFTISSTLKGKSRKFLILEDENYIYDNVPEPEAETAEESEPAEEPGAEEPEPEEEPEFEEEEDSNELKSGDTLLLFIKDGGEEEGPSLTDYRDGIKKLSMEKIGVYEARINELNSIFAAKKVDAARLLEWVIRCAEDPVTRWEGTFELLQSVQAQEWVERAAQQRKDRIANGMPVEEELTEVVVESEEPDELRTKNFDTSVFAKMLDINHKQTLANILLNGYGSFAQGSERSGPIAGDRELIELVKRWGDPRLMGFLLDKLRAGSDDAGSNANTMGIVAEILDDDEAAEIAQKYEENAYQEDDEAVEAEADDSEDAKEEETSDAETEQEKTVEAEPASETDQADDPVVAEAGSDDEQPQITKLTYKEFRAELIQKFLAQCDKAIAMKDTEREIKPAR